jgi:hypothetical protein
MRCSLVPKRMDELTFASQLVDSLAWPLTTLGIAFVLRSSITRLLLRLSKAKYKDVELEFGKELEDLEQRAARAELPEKATQHQPTPFVPESLGDYIERISRVSPRAAILESWVAVELAIFEAAARLNVRLPSPSQPVVALRHLESTGALSSEVQAMIQGLRSLRNKAAHAEEFDIQPAQAAEYGKLAERIIASIRAIEAE